MPNPNTTSGTNIDGSRWTAMAFNAIRWDDRTDLGVEENDFPPTPPAPSLEELFNARRQQNGRTVATPSRPKRKRMTEEERKFVDDVWSRLTAGESVDQKEVSAYKAIVKKYRHLTRDERVIFNQPTKDTQRNMADLIVEDLPLPVSSNIPTL